MEIFEVKVISRDKLQEINGGINWLAILGLIIWIFVSAFFACLL